MRVPKEPNIIFRSYRHIVTGGFPLRCPRCGKHSETWTAFEMPNGAQEMSEAIGRVRGFSNFYIFTRLYRVSFPACGHQEEVSSGAVVRFYGFY